MLPLYDTIPVRQPAIAVWLLICVHVLVFLTAIALPSTALVELVDALAAVPARFLIAWAAGQVPPLWTLVTCVFLHAGWLHLIANLWGLWIFGDNVEDRMGPARFLLFYLLCGAAASSAEVLAHPTSPAPLLGASGAIAGVMGAYLAMYPRARIVLLVPLLFWPLYFDVSAFVFLLYWLVIQVLGGGLGLGDGALHGGIAYWAHIGGFLAGLASYRLFLGPAGRAHAADETGLENAWSRWPEDM